MNEEILEMMNIYNTYELDWMGEKINDYSDLTRHHIVKKQYDGIDNIKNYALLTTSSHHLIHYLEVKYNKEYNILNKLFLDLNNSMAPPGREYYEEVMNILKKVKKDIKNKKRNKLKKNRR